MSGSNTDANPLAGLQPLLHADEIITSDSPEYQTSTLTWAAQKYSSPSLVIRPTSVDALSKALAYLYNTNLEFAIYGQGFSSASAKDVLVNTSAFDDFHFDAHSEVVIIGAGQTWANVYQQLREVAPRNGGKNSIERFLFAVRKLIRFVHTKSRALARLASV